MTEKEYRDSKLTFNKKGIFIGGQNIMWAYEKDWIKKEVKKLLEGVESVLEIGYGLGYTASVFERCKRHVIIEAHPIIAAQARCKGYEVVEGFVQNVKLDEYFDLIYDDRAEFVHLNDNLKWLENFNYGRFEQWRAPKFDTQYQKPKY